MSNPAPEQIRIATRASQLALWQANHVAGLIRDAFPDCHVELVEISTSGDRDRVQSLASMGGQGVFTREVQHAVLDGRADIAVHSLKDLPTEPADGLALAGVPDRESVYDALILPESKAAEPPEETDQSAIDLLDSGARIGTGSLRRQAQLLHHRPDLNPVDIRGNVETRLRKLDDGEYDAVVLAVAGLTRLGLASRISFVFGPPLMLGAVGQGALGIECRDHDERVRSVLGAITNSDVLASVSGERSLLRELRAGCHAPVAVHSETVDGNLRLDGVVLSTDGKERLAATVSRPTDEANACGIELASALRDQGADRILGAEGRSN